MLHRKLFVFIFALLLSACATTTKTMQLSQPSLPELGKDATIAFVFASLSNEERIRPYCTGVWINKDTMLTALHCAQAAATIAEIRKLPPALRIFAPLLIKEVKDPTGAQMDYITNTEVVDLESKPRDMHTSTVLAIDEEHDLALVKANKKDMPSHPWLRIANEMPKVGDKVFVIGHPGGLYFTFFDGMVSAIRENDKAEFDKDTKIRGPFIQVFSGIYPGSSGGPVINQKGEIVGIVSFTMNAPNQGFAIATPSIKRFMYRMHDKNLL